jgi:hypothetical protein
MTTSLSNIKVTDGTNNMVIKADDITLNGTSVLVDSATWGNIDGTLSNQADLQTALNNKQDEATAVNYDNITNCITEIPQDIKLELNDGVLTIKSGSKVYVPNGSNTFDVYTLTTDFESGDISGIDRDYSFFVNPSKTGMAGGAVTRCYSGTTAPITPSLGYFWYDTTSNSIKRWDGTSWVSGFSLPFCIISTGATNINQVFNGFGYIGSTVFALPGVKGLIANGRNADGSLKNIEFMTSNVLTTTASDTGSFTNAFVGFNPNSGTVFGYDLTAYYDKELNQVIAGGSNWGRLVLGTLDKTSGKYSNFNHKTAFHAVDYNDFENLKEEVDNISVATDDTTISKNTSNQLQAIGTINKNTATGAINPKYDWVGTLAEYEAQSIATSHPTWICYITDDITGGTSVYTKNEMDALLDDKLDADQLQVVSVLPASPDPNTFYFVTD